MTNEHVFTIGFMTVATVFMMLAIGQAPPEQKSAYIQMSLACVVVTTVLIALFTLPIAN